MYSQQDAFSTVFARVMDAQQKREVRLIRRRERERRNRASETESAEQRQVRLARRRVRDRARRVVLGATDYWLRFEWQHRGSPHVHGLAWLPNAPGVEQLLSSSDNLEAAKKEITEYADSLISTYNPAVLPDGSNIDDAPAPKTDPHVCNLPYTAVEDFDQDFADLLLPVNATPGRCSAAYCLRTKNGTQECRFGYPKPLQPNTALVVEDEPTLLTAHNDGMLVEETKFYVNNGGIVYSVKRRNNIYHLF